MRWYHAIGMHMACHMHASMFAWHAYAQAHMHKHMCTRNVHKHICTSTYAQAHMHICTSTYASMYSVVCLFLIAEGIQGSSDISWHCTMPSSVKRGLFALTDAEQNSPNKMVKFAATPPALVKAGNESIDEDMDMQSEAFLKCISLWRTPSM